MSINFNIVGKRIKESRIHNQMSQADLAERIDMSASYISRIETAKKQASLETLVRLADVLGVTVDYLLTGNQTNDSAEYQTDFMRLVEDCSSSEKQIIFDVASATKKSLRENKGLQHKDDQS